MKVLFVSSACENLGIEYLSAVLKQNGHTTSLIYDPQLFNDTFLYSKWLSAAFSFREELLCEVKQQQPDLVAISVVSDNYLWACSLAAQIKTVIDVPIVFGGIHPTSVPEYVMEKPFVDYVVVGEGEGALIDLVNNLHHPKACLQIPNVCAREGNRIVVNPPRPLIQDLDSLPMPDKDLYYTKLPFKKNGYLALSSRGCINKCTFCNNSLFKNTIYAPQKKDFLRRRSPENVIQELRLAKEKYNIPTIHFWDEIFISDHRWLTDFLSRYRDEIHLPFTCCIHANFINQEIVELLEGAHCWQAIMGVQSLDEQMKRTILHRYESNEKIKEVVQLFAKTNIALVCENMLGLPEQREDDLVHMMKFYNKYRPSRLSLYFLRYYPGTEIVEIAREKGILSAEDVEEINRGNVYQSFIMGGTTANKNFAKIQSLWVFLLVLPGRLNRFLIDNKMYRFMPRLGMLCHSISRILDRNKKYDINAGRFVRRYRLFMRKKILSWFSSNAKTPRLDYKIKEYDQRCIKQ